jgi:RNA polymerase sigma-70 factor (ECF subfamily)
MTNAEIAEVMGTSVSATEALLKRGRQRLREILKRSAVDVKRLLEID